MRAHPRPLYRRRAVAGLSLFWLHGTAYEAAGVADAATGIRVCTIGRELAGNAGQSVADKEALTSARRKGMFTSSYPTPRP